jgi:hypothetical protein
MTGSPGAPLTNPQPPAGGFLLAHPEDWFKPLFDKMQSILDAAGGPQDLVTDFSLVPINPSPCTHSLKAKPSASGWGFFIGPPRGLVQTPVRQNAKHFGRRRRSAGLGNRLQSGTNQSLPLHAPIKSKTLSLRLGVFYWPTQRIGSTPVLFKADRPPKGGIKQLLAITYLYMHS